MSYHGMSWRELDERMDEPWLVAVTGRALGKARANPLSSLIQMQRDFHDDDPPPAITVIVDAIESL